MKTKQKDSKKKEPKVLWIAVTPDRYEFPICVCDSQKDLAERLGTTVSNISHLAERKRRSSRSKYYVYKVRNV